MTERRFKHDGEKCPRCQKGKFFWRQYCGAYVCVECSNHLGLARCFCGWTRNKSEPYPEEELALWG